LNANLFAIATFILIASPLAARADVPPNQTVHLTNGATAVGYNHCGDNDLCARINYQDGSALSIYSEGAAECQPYYLHFVESDASGKTTYEFSRPINHTIPKGFSCGHTVSTEMVLDRGYVHLLVTENPDGTLNVAFSAIPK
jgi:hypothetical protein